MKKLLTILLFVLVSLAIYADANTSGFYKADNSNLLYAQSTVYNQSYQLFRDQHETYSYPVDGWYWFDTEEEARAFLKIPEVLDEP